MARSSRTHHPTISRWKNQINTYRSSRTSTWVRTLRRITTSWILWRTQMWWKRIWTSRWLLSSVKHHRLICRTSRHRIIRWVINSWRIVGLSPLDVIQLLITAGTLLKKTTNRWINQYLGRFSKVWNTATKMRTPSKTTLLCKAAKTCLSPTALSATSHHLMQIGWLRFKTITK